MYDSDRDLLMAVGTVGSGVQPDRTSCPKSDTGPNDVPVHYSVLFIALHPSRTVHCWSNCKMQARHPRTEEHAVNTITVWRGACC